MRHHTFTKLPRPVTVGVSSPALRREQNPAEAENLLRVHPRAYTHGFPRRGINKKNGFTLIELLVVISIISLLSSVVLVSLNSAKGYARDAHRLSNINGIRMAIELFYNTNGAYPDETGAGSGFDGWETSAEGDFLEGLTSQYIPKVPLDPINTIKTPSNFFGERRIDGNFFYAYYSYNFANAGTQYGCPWSGIFAVLAIRAVERMNPSTLPKAQCGPQPCPDGGIPGVCRDWSNEFDYSIFLVP